MGKGFWQYRWFFKQTAIILAAVAVAFFASTLISQAATGDAIEIKSPKKTPSVKEGALAPEGEAKNPKDDVSENESENTPKITPAGSGKVELTPKDANPTGIVAPNLPVGKEGAPGLAGPLQGGKQSGAEGDDSRKEPAFPIEENYLRFKSSESVFYDKNAKLLKLTGDVVIEIEDITLTADYVEVNDMAFEIYAKGHVAIWQQDDIIFGDELFMNYSSKYFRITNPSGNSSGKDINGHVYFEGKNLEGTFDRYVVTKGRLTTCEPYCGRDEYHVQSQKIIVKPKKMVEMEHNYSYVQNRKVFYWPYIVIPLEKTESESKRGPFDQTYGHNQTEGWFAKYAWTYRVRYKSDLQDPLIGVAILEFIENKGMNIGQRQDFYFTDLGVTTIKWEYLFSNESTETKTTASLFNELDWESPADKYRLPSQDAEAKKPQDFYYKLSQDLKFSQSTTGSISIERTNKYNLYRSRTNSFRSSFAISRRKENVQTSLNISNNWTATTSSTSSESKSINTTGSFTNSVKLSNKMDWTLGQTYSATKTTNSGSANQEGTFTSDIRYTEKKYNFGFKWQEVIDFDDDNFLGDRNQNVTHFMPQVTFKLKRNIWERQAKSFSDIDLALSNTQSGRRNELESIVHFKLNTGWSKNYSFSKYSTLNTSVDFEQNIYDDGNAVYEYSPRVSYTYNPRTWWDLNLSWSQRQPEGRASPFVERGYRSSSNNFTGKINFTNNRSWRMAFNTTYDYKLSKWGALNGRWVWDPNDNFGITTESVWDTETRTFRNTRITTSYYADSGKWNLFTRTDINMSKPSKDRSTPDGGSMEHKEHVVTLDKVTVAYNRSFIRNWDLQVLSEYSRSNSGKGFKLIRRLALTKVNCCTTIQLAYDASRKEYSLQVFINAFPGKTVTATGRSEGSGESESMQFYLDTPANDLFNPSTFTGGGLGAFY